MKIQLPEIDQDGIKVERFTMSGLAAGMSALKDGGRWCPEGEYTRLTVDGRLWMSDTPAECRDHWEPIHQAKRYGGRVLINGLGLGLVVQEILALPNIEHVDVVEINERVARVIGPHYASDRCTIHLADAYQQTKAWPSGTRWTVAWHDIWPDLCEDQLSDRSRLLRSYGRRTDWQGCWGQETILYQRRRTANAPWR